MRLDHGGHLTHGLKVNFSGKLYDVAGYGVDRETGLVDFDEVLPAGEGAPAEADRLRRLRLSAHDRGRPLPGDRRRGRRAPPLRHGPHRGARRGRPPPEPGAALRLRHLDDATRRSPARAPGFILCKEEHAQARRQGGLPGDAGRPAPARDRRQGDVLQDRRVRGVPRLPGADPRERGRARRVAPRGRARPPHRRHGHAPGPGRPAQERVDGQGGRGAAARGEDHRQPQHRALRRAPADGGLRHPARHAGGDDARLRRGRPARGGGDHRRRARRRRPGRAVRDGATRSASGDPLYPGYRGYPEYRA